MNFRAVQLLTSALSGMELAASEPDAAFHLLAALASLGEVTIRELHEPDFTAYVVTCRWNNGKNTAESGREPSLKNAAESCVRWAMRWIGMPPCKCGHRFSEHETLDGCLVCMGHVEGPLELDELRMLGEDLPLLCSCGEYTPWQQ